DISQLLGFEVVNPFYPGRPITVSHLLTHTSTIVDNRTYLEMAENDPQAFNHTDIRDFLSPDGRYYSRDNFARFCPGEEFVYSNLAIGVLGSIVECLSGMRYDSYCQEHIFAPLGMDAGFEPAAIRNWHNYAVLYRVPLFRKRGYLIGSDQGMDRPVRRTITTRVGSALGCNPAGGLRVNVVDLAKFMIMLSNGGVFGNRRLLGQISSEIMRCVAWQGNGMNGLYKYKSLGFHITEDLVPEVRLIGHSAEAYGMIGDAYFRPDDGWGMIFFLNGGVTRDAVDSGFYEVEMAMADRLYAHMQKLKLEENKSND
ncbi:MAG: beta-lactamase family protein, partial [Negativicutes bacterium]|nr:beta-lactamase family protein [Negativicutes bacterium]